MIGSRKPNTRADHVRTRRVKEMKQRVIIATGAAKKPSQYAPIYSRNGDDTVPIRQKAQKRTRRKFFYAFKNGVEINYRHSRFLTRLAFGFRCFIWPFSILHLFLLDLTFLPGEPDLSIRC